jgi:phage terminase small subunit
MIRPNLLAWQWSDYAAKHQDRRNLLAHIVAVPAFQLATLGLVIAVAARSITGVIVAVVAMIAALVVQGRGHQREAEAPTRFDGVADFVSRFVVEQWVTFPRFVLSGGWAINLGRARRAA